MWLNLRRSVLLNGGLGTFMWRSNFRGDYIVKLSETVYKTAALH